MVLKFKKIIITGVVIILISSIFLNHKRILQIFYPLEYEEIILAQSIEYELDFYLVNSIIYVESKFDSKVTSNKGAIGLMQIMPKTGVWIADNLGYDNFEVDELYDPEVNVRCGCWYLSELMKKFDGNLIAVLAAYNGGEGNVSRWLEEERWDGRHENVNDIPFPETRGYVSKVMDVSSKYRYIYSVREDRWQ